MSISLLFISSLLRPAFVQLELDWLFMKSERYLPSLPTGFNSDKMAMGLIIVNETIQTARMVERAWRLVCHFRDVRGWQMA